MRGVISPKLTSFLAQANETLAEAKQAGISFSAERVRDSLKNLSALNSDCPHVALIKDSCLDADNHQISVRIYNPMPEKALPVLLHFHGGGHMCGDADVYDGISRKLAIAASAIVIFVDYRLSPEHPYPAGIDDCQHVLLHYKSLLEDMRYKDTLYIAGDSAGGAICTTLTMNNLDSAGVKIDKQILIYPSVDYTMSNPSVDENGEGFLLEKDKIKWYFEQYFNCTDTLGSVAKKASPLFGLFSKNMPETLVITAGCDPLRDEGNAYVNAMEAAGAYVVNHQFPGMIHAFMLIEDLVKEECEQSYQLISTFVHQ